MTLSNNTCFHLGSIVLGKYLVNKLVYSQQLIVIVSNIDDDILS